MFCKCRSTCCSNYFLRSQRVIAEDAGGMTFSLEVVWNFELEREILGFGESISVLAPRRLRKKMAGRIGSMMKLYQDA